MLNKRVTGINFEDIVGRTIGQLTIKKLKKRTKNHIYYDAMCSCGTLIETNRVALLRKSALPKSCSRCYWANRRAADRKRKSNQVYKKILINVGKTIDFIKILNLRKIDYHYEYEVFCSQCGGTSWISRRSLERYVGKKTCKNCRTETFTKISKLDGVVHVVNGLSKINKDVAKNDLLATIKLTSQPWLYARAING